MIRVHRTARVVTTASVLTVSLLASSCGGGSQNSGGDVTSTTEPSTATPTDPEVTSPPTSTASKPNLEEGEPAISSVSLLIDADSNEVQETSVALGTPMTIRIRSSVADEFHLHGYDLELTGTDVTFNFVADRLGEFELEMHDSGAKVLILTVLED